MLATDFTRDDCLIGKKRRTYATLTREYVCNKCGGRLDTQWSDDTGRYPEQWFIRCVVCSEQDFIHEQEYQRQQYEAAEVLEGLPADLAVTLGHERILAHEGIFSLHGEPIEL